MLLAHGSGSFGHVVARGTAIDPSLLEDLAREQPDDELWTAAARTQDAAARLHRLVMAELLEAEVPAYSIVPSSFMVGEGGGSARLCVATTRPLRMALERRLVPVTLGDVIMDSAHGARIASTEEILLALCSSLKAEGVSVSRCLWLGETAGVLDGEGGVVPRIGRETIEEARSWATRSAGVDVTGGMRLRLDVAWSLAVEGVDSWIGDGRGEGALERALEWSLGERHGAGSLGTRVSAR